MLPEIINKKVHKQIIKSKMMISKVPIATISHKMSGPKMTKQASKDDFEIEMPFKKQ